MPQQHHCLLPCLQRPGAAIELVQRSSNELCRFVDMPRLELQTNRRQSFHNHGEGPYDDDKQVLTHKLQVNVKLGIWRKIHKGLVV